MINRKIVIAGVLALSLVFTGISAYAVADSGNTAVQEKIKPENRFVFKDFTEEQRNSICEARENSMKEAVQNLVEKGTVTQEEANEILTYADGKADGTDSADVAKDTENQGEFRGKGRHFKGMFKNLDEEQIKALFEESETLFKAKLENLVSQNVITQEIADQVNLKQFNKTHGPRGGMRGNFTGNNLRKEQTESQQV